MVYLPLPTCHGRVSRCPGSRANTISSLANTSTTTTSMERGKPGFVYFGCKNLQGPPLVSPGSGHAHAPPCCLFANPSKTEGYYASWLLSAFTIGTLLSSYAWGIFADRFGRKPVLIIGVCATGVYAITFGLSESLASALASRCVHVCYGYARLCVVFVSHIF